MTGPEHYREAERLLALSENTPSNYDETNPAATLLAAQATAHFLAAQVAATAMQAGVDGCEPGMEPAEYDAWYQAMGVNAPKGGTR